MYEIVAKPLTKEAFKPYGEYVDLIHMDEYFTRPGQDAGFFPDLIRLNFGITTMPVVNCCLVKKSNEWIVRGTEYHSYTCEGLCPVNGDVVIFVGRPARGFGPAPCGADLEAFIIPQGTYVRFNCGIQHGTQFPIDKDYVSLICQLPERTYANDCVRIKYEEGQEAKIVMPK